jgi:hypothetical protein
LRAAGGERGGKQGSGRESEHGSRRSVEGGDWRDSSRGEGGEKAGARVEVEGEDNKQARPVLTTRDASTRRSCDPVDCGDNATADSTMMCRNWSISRGHVTGTLKSLEIDDDDDDDDDDSLCILP